jgi:hypothetical protein
MLSVDENLTIISIKGKNKGSLNLKNQISIEDSFYSMKTKFK